MSYNNNSFPYFVCVNSTASPRTLVSTKTISLIRAREYDLYHSPSLYTTLPLYSFVLASYRNIQTEERKRATEICLREHRHNIEFKLMTELE